MRNAATWLVRFIVPSLADAPAAMRAVKKKLLVATVSLLVVLALAAWWNRARLERLSMAVTRSC